MLLPQKSDKVKYDNIIPGTFLSRPNRFIANILINGTVECCHVKNTGRCRELLIPGAEVFVQKASSTERKTKFDLISVRKNDMLINIDSAAPNKIAAEIIPTLYPELTALKSEVRYGASRFDFRADFSDLTRYIEVKGVTLEENGIAMFPDAPTLRGVKHLQELAHCVQNGFGGTILFIIQMSGMKYMIPNDTTHPEFGQSLRAAKAAGVEILAVDCTVTPDSLIPNGFVSVVL